MHLTNLGNFGILETLGNFPYMTSGVTWRPHGSDMLGVMRTSMMRVIWWRSMEGTVVKWQTIVAG
jgi:hypothetical protein